MFVAYVDKGDIVPLSWRRERPTEDATAILALGLSSAVCSRVISFYTKSRLSDRAARAEVLDCRDFRLQNSVGKAPTPRLAASVVARCVTRTGCYTVWNPRSLGVETVALPLPLKTKRNMIATGVLVLAGTAFWEAQFQIVRRICSGLPTKTEKERAFVKCLPSYVVSYAHAFFLTWAGVRIVLALQFASDLNHQGYLYATNVEPEFVKFVERTTLVFFTCTCSLSQIQAHCSQPLRDCLSVLLVTTVTTTYITSALFVIPGDSTPIHLTSRNTDTFLLQSQTSCTTRTTWCWSSPTWVGGTWPCTT